MSVRGVAGDATETRSYGEILRLDELLKMQEAVADVHDALFFVTVHQVYELWFLVLLHDLEGARDAMLADDLHGAIARLRRVHAVERVLVEQVATLETISPSDFAKIRSALGDSSGMQSVQFREIEFISGLKDPGYLDGAHLSQSERLRVARRLSEPGLWDGFLAILDRSDTSSLTELIDEGRGSVLADLAEALLCHDQGFALWRARHVLMVERMIGYGPGTGGSSGVDYLRTTLFKRFYPALWAVRTTG
jgi:tryptophan 2,3-dioxygenase